MSKRRYTDIDVQASSELPSSAMSSISFSKKNLTGRKPVSSRSHHLRKKKASSKIES
jgi:hypothetical protein